MFNYFIPVTLTLLILIAQNILLLNEETLILLCFITFCYLGLKNLSHSFKTDLDKKSDDIENKLKLSLEKTIFSLKSILNVQNKFWYLFFNFKLIGDKCASFVNSISDWSVIHKSKLNKTPFSKRLHFISKLEKQNSKLISLLLVHKINEVAVLKHYYSSNLNHSYFLCSDKINIREYLQLIKK